jgi:hypothetical protein
MFVVKLTGGLGNQMFQYVFGQHLSHRFSMEVKYEISYFEKPIVVENVTSWAYELGKFNIDVPIIDDDFFYQLQDLGRANKIKYVLFKTFFNFKNSFFIIPESNYQLFKCIPLFIKNRYFIGYWQNEIFFAGIEDQISEWFILKDQFESKKENTKILSKIHNSNSISIAVRRGDHVKLNASSDLDYYHKAIEIICSKVHNPFFFIFSDDIDWCKKNLIINHEHIFVNGSESLPFEDMELMSKCQHNIMSNSTYSWWGAYLNKNQYKIVISPKNSRPLSCPNFIQV